MKGIQHRLHNLNLGRVYLKLGVQMDGKNDPARSARMSVAGCNAESVVKRYVQMPGILFFKQ